MDPLSDLLRIVRLDGAFFYTVEASAPWGVRAAPAAVLSPKILPAAEHLIPYHFLVDGSCHGGLVGEPPVEMRPGDVIMFPHGDPHLMSSGPEMDPAAEERRTPADRYLNLVQIGEGPERTATFVCGFLGWDRRPFNPLLAALPRCMHMRGLPHTGFGEMARQLAEESSRGRAGAEGVLTRLAELMFLGVVRRYLEQLPAGQTGWLAGLRDEVVGRALEIIHARPGEDWTLDSLAHAVASSRSNFSRRFTDIVGQSPMQYLAQWRMQVAANLLHQSGAKVATIASEVGYESEAAFSRAFKKATGVAPGAWRERRRSSREGDAGHA